MKAIYVLSFIFLLSCGNEKAKAVADNQSDVAAATSSKNQNSNNSAPVNSEITASPVGGPADFTINVEGLQAEKSFLIGFY